MAKAVTRRSQRTVSVFTAALLGLLAFVTPASAVAVSTSPAQPTAPECMPGLAPDPAVADLAALNELNPDDAPPTLYVFAIDTSASMRGARYDEVKEAMRALVKALSPRDRVALVRFDSTASTIQPPAPAPEAAAVIDDLPEPDGSFTDIGGGVQQALAELKGTRQGEAGVVVLFSDGDHEPTGKSAFPKNVGAGWDRLRADADELSKGRPIRAYAVSLDRLSGVKLLCSVFPGAQLLPAGSNSEALYDYLQRIHTTSRLDAASRLLAADRGRGVTVNWALPEQTQIGDRAVDIVLHVSSTAAHLPVVLEGLRIEGTGDVKSVDAQFAPRLELAPRQTVDLPVQVRWTLPERSSWVGKRVSSEGALRLAGTVTSPLAVRLSALPIPDGPFDVRSEVEAPLLGMRGDVPARWNPLPLLLAVAALVVAAYLTHLRFPPVAGAIHFIRKDDRAGYDNEDIELRPPIELRGRWTHRWSRHLVDMHGPTGEKTKLRVIISARGGIQPRIRVKLRLPDLTPQRGATRDIPLGKERLIAGINVRHDCAVGKPRRWPTRGS